MILEGYGSSSEEEVDREKENLKEEKTVTGSKSSGSIDSKSSAQPNEDGRKRRRAHPKGKKLRKPGQDPASLDYVGPWGMDSDSSNDEGIEVENVGKRETDSAKEEEAVIEEETQSMPVEVLTTELYTLEPFMEDTTPNKMSLAEFSVPKRVVFVLKGHTKSVTKVRFFPGGSMLLSSGNDGNIYLWSLRTKSMVRGYFGHTQAVKDIIFNASGEKFVSIGLDKKVVVWDTKTGDILRRMELAAIPNAIIINPNNENEIVVGLLNRRIEHYDLSQSDTPIQTYDHHLGAINSLTVVDSNTKFMSTSDDRTIRFWDWQINIPCKIIADPTQHSTPHAAVHPTESFIALQMMDNTIQVIQGSGKFRYNRNKTFQGHRVAGYGIQIAISPDGQVVMSGDIGGYVYFWKWKTGRFIKKIKVSDSLISCIDVSVNGVAAAGSSGDIYFCE